MATTKMNFEAARRIGVTMPGVTESTMYGAPALKLRGELLACIPLHRSAEAGSLAVRVSFEDRAELLAASPDVYYVTDHYLNYETVLVRLSHISADVLRDLLGMAYKFVNSQIVPRPQSRDAPKTPARLIN
jgi:hypothetical protein